MKADIRRLALDILCEHQAAGKYMNLALSTHRIDSLSTSERAQLTALVYTTTERRLTYDYYISALSKRESDKIDSYTKNILRLGLCQLLDMRSIPDFAAVNETVKLARNPGERSFVNGVLRAAERSKDSLPMPSEEKNYRRYLSVKYSFPLWIVKELDSLYGRTECEEMLRLFNEKKYTDLTVNTLRVTPEKLLSAFSEGNIDGEISADCGISVRLNSSKNPESLPGFGDGWFFVQDRASLVSAMALGANAGELIIDACACPGGKSFATAILTGDRADIRSFDLHPTKLSLIESGAERLGLGSIKVGELDALTPDESLFGLADRVICDVPCSGLGVLGKKPDLRYKSPEDAVSLPELQYEILCQSAKYLKVGGRLTYSTCTILPRENAEVVRRFLDSHDNFVSEDFAVGDIRSEVGMLTMLPTRHSTDGFFVAAIRRIK